MDRSFQRCWSLSELANRSPTKHRRHNARIAVEVGKAIRKLDGVPKEVLLIEEGASAAVRRDDCAALF